MSRQHNTDTESGDFILHLADDHWTHEQIQCALLADIRREQRKTNALLERLVGTVCCHNAVAIPSILRRIDRRLAKKVPL